ncbi:hypothetical protein JTE90_019257 [Oedothorax gibbosus]|uniref:Uncharacterized protein n=1 Tax=Oedothorax gibbosus TaxID=931172 RepID=A0AAV6URV1_9ARAC|nr:hypothetical protein JTE90_019257 [Oedothorax gibbosus]
MRMDVMMSGNRRFHEPVLHASLGTRLGLVADPDCNKKVKEAWRSATGLYVILMGNGPLPCEEASDTTL